MHVPSHSKYIRYRLDVSRHERTLLNCPEDKDRQRFFAPEWDLSLGYCATVVVENWRTAETAAARRVKSMIRRCLACADEC